jgi:hypothetical protein
MQGLFTVENRHGSRFIARWEHNRGRWELHLWEDGETIAAWSGMWVRAEEAHRFNPIPDEQEMSNAY